MEAVLNVVSVGELEKKSNAELVRIYNELHPEKPVKRFESQAAGIRRIIHRLAEKQNALPAALQPPVKQLRATPRPLKEEPKAGRKPFNLPVGEIKAHRPGTKRAKVLDMLLFGATFADVQKATGWPYRTAYEGIKLINTELGYGLVEDEAGVIRAVRR